MFKAITLIALGAVASAQFLDSRDLQGVELAQTGRSPLTAATAFPTACTSSETADSCPSDYCCAKLSRGGATVATAAAVCAPVEFDDQPFLIADVWNVWYCNHEFNVNAFKTRYASSVACNGTTVCPVGSCCATFSDFFGSATSSATNTERRNTTRYC